MARPMKPLVRGGGYYPSNGWTPLAYAGGYTTANGGGEPEPPPIEKTITGNPIHITDALAKPVQALSIALEPIQDLHGYDNPWPAGGGVNLLPSGGAFDTTKNGIRFVSDGKGTYTITGTATADAAYNFSISEINIPSTVYLHMLNNVSTYNVAFAFFNGNTQITAPTPVPANSVKDLSASLGGETVNKLRLFVANGYTANLTFSPMLCVDNTVKPFAPYSNICPISGWTEAKVTRTGKNLWSLASSGSATNAFIFKPQDIHIIPAGTYTLSFTGSIANAVQFTFRRADNSSVASTILNARSVAGGKYSATITFTEDIYRASAYSNGDSSIENIMFNLGSTATAYEPYQGATYTITFPSEAGTVYGGTLDVTQGKLTVDRAMVDLGTLSWGAAKNGGTQVAAWTVTSSLTGIIKGVSANTVIGNIVCTKYKADTANRVFTGADKSIAVVTNGQVTVYDTALTGFTSEQVIAAMNGVQLCYELATPIVYDLTPTQIDTLLGTNNVWSDGEMTLVYLADGNASDEEALNILLGGRYVNNHGEDEPTDREALNILLGGNR